MPEQPLYAGNNAVRQPPLNTFLCIKVGICRRLLIHLLQCFPGIPGDDIPDDLPVPEKLTRYGCSHKTCAGRRGYLVGFGRTVLSTIIFAGRGVLFLCIAVTTDPAGISYDFASAGYTGGLGYPYLFTQRAGAVYAGVAYHSLYVSAFAAGSFPQAVTDSIIIASDIVSKRFLMVIIPSLCVFSLFPSPTALRGSMLSLGHLSEIIILYILSIIKRPR